MKEKIGIIGAGLMGGSLFKGIEGSILLGEDWPNQIEELDLLILAVPISVILEIGEKVTKLPLKKKLLVLDIGSVKEAIAEKFALWTRDDLEFLATHPMAGKEKSGFEHSDPLIFKGAPWIITPHDKNLEASLQKVENLILRLGAKPIRMDAAEHDQKAALISQLPFLISKTLFDLVDPESRAIGGPGFHSMVRLAHDNPEMRREIGLYNRKNIDYFLKKYIEVLQNQIGGG